MMRVDLLFCLVLYLKHRHSKMDRFRWARTLALAVRRKIGKLRGKLGWKVPLHECRYAVRRVVVNLKRLFTRNRVGIMTDSTAINPESTFTRRESLHHYQNVPNAVLPGSLPDITEDTANDQTDQQAKSEDRNMETGQIHEYVNVRFPRRLNPLGPRNSISEAKSTVRLYQNLSPPGTGSSSQERNRSKSIPNTNTNSIENQIPSYLRPHQPSTSTAWNTTPEARIRPAIRITSTGDGARRVTEPEVRNPALRPVHRNQVAPQIYTITPGGVPDSNHSRSPPRPSISFNLEPEVLNSNVNKRLQQMTEPINEAYNQQVQNLIQNSQEALSTFQPRERLANLPQKFSLSRDKLSKHFDAQKQNFNLRQHRLQAVGLFFLMASVSSLIIFDSIADIVLDSQFQLSEGNIFTNAWKEIPIPLNIDFHIFGVRNGDAILEGEKPDMVEYGPFSYRVRRVRKVLHWTSETVIFTERFILEYNPDRSKTLDTKMFVPNLPILVSVNFVKNMMDQFYMGFLGPIVHNVLMMAMRTTGERVIELRTAREILAGRPINILVYLEMFLKPLRAAGIPIPDYTMGNYKLHDLGFGYTMLFGGNDFGPFEHFRRTENGHQMNEVKKILGQTKYDKYKSPCNRIHGLDPMVFGTRLDAESITLYNQHACRTIQMIRNGTHWVNGIRSARYVIDPRMFDMRRRENRCYCYEKSLAECDGWTDIGGCVFGVSLGLSMPHFLFAPRRLAEVGGLTPNVTRHWSYMEVEPNLGIPFEASLAFQMNLLVQPIPGVPPISSMQRALLPVMWFRLHAKAESHWAVMLFLGSTFLNFGKYLFALVLATLGVLCFHHSLRKTTTTATIPIK